MNRNKRWLAGVVVPLVALGALAGAQSANAAACTSTSGDFNCGPYSDSAVYHGANGAELVAQDVWNPVPGWSQKLQASNGTAWTVQASMPAGNGAVVSYPDTQVTYTLPDGHPATMDSFGQLSSSWSNINPAGTGLDYEYAYDVWLADPAQQSWVNDQEIMIWTDNHGQTPAGTPTGETYTDPAGMNWTVWVDKGSSTVGADAIVTFVRDTDAATGSVNLTGFFTWLKAHGHTSAAAGVDQIDYGPELCSTGGATLLFGLNSYRLVKAVPPGPVLSGGHVVATGRATGEVAWHQTVSQTSVVTINGPGAINGKRSSVSKPDAKYSGLKPGSTYTVSIQPTVAGKASGKTGKVTFRTRH